MEVRVLMETEIPSAAGLSRYVFDVCLRNRMSFEQTIGFVEEYLGAEHLAELVRTEKLILWGAFEAEQLIGVSAMQPDGFITMLYVLPQHSNRGCGRMLLATMRQYAKNVCGVQQVIVNATPAWTSSYFARLGFAYDHHNLNVPFLTMRAVTGESYVVEKKPVSAKVIVGAALGCLAFATIACIAYVIWFALN